MHIHILGICGTFMGGVAVLAREAGHTVTGSDRNVYPPMSTQLAEQGIALHEGFDGAVLEPPPDAVVVGNVMSRGMPVIERLLDADLPYTSGPAWLAEHVLRGRHVLAVAGTHGKTSTASMLAWILEAAGLAPGFLIGGVPGNFGVSARLGGGKCFVVEADEYDTAFFDKRSKFVHYRPRTLVLTNVEFDHGDIFDDLSAIRRQFHHLVRTVPGTGRIIRHAGEAELDAVLEMGCWTPVERYGLDGAAVEWRAQIEGPPGQQRLTVHHRGERASGAWSLPGRHNAENALAACAAAIHAGVDLATAVRALAGYGGVRRRLELAGTAGGVTVYDDFAHHPTEIAASIAAVRPLVRNGRLVAVFEPRSNTMKMGLHRDRLAASLGGADQVALYAPADLPWDPAEVMTALGTATLTASDVDTLVAEVVDRVEAGDHVLVMSNGSFGGFPHRLLRALHAREPR